ncbi:MAG: magnesium transporter [Deltaproteobacteria bacterium]|nr:magnesium transporter [Deltaproteobacteria bacterium]
MDITQQNKNYRYANTFRRLLRRNARPNIRKILSRTHPADIANIFAFFPLDDKITLLNCTNDNEIRAEIITNLQLHNAAELISRLETKLAVDIICEMSGDDQADLLGELDEAHAAEIIAAMPVEESRDLENLLNYHEKSAGGIMNPDVLAIHSDSTIAEAIKTVQEATDVDMFFYLYVVDENKSLIGVLSLRHLVTSKPNILVKNIMNPNVVSVRTDEDQEDVARLVTRYDFLAIPVVDDTNTLVGAVSVDDVIDVISEEATEDILKMAGAGDAPTDYSSLMKQTLSRLPWLFAALLGGLVVALIINYFNDTLIKFIALAGFIPVISGMAGNVGTQSLAIVVRGLATRRINVRQIWKVIGNEILVGMVLGLIYGVLLGAVGYWQFLGNTPLAINLGIAIGISTISAMTISTLLAAGMPLFFAKLNIDPAVATGPFVTTTTDIIGVTAYFLIVNVMI